MIYYSTKTYGNDRGFSCAFRQPNASHSHCSLIHGYSLGFKFTFTSEKLDDKNWVYDFGNCKWIKKFLEDKFDHTLALDKSDPHFDYLFDMKNKGLANVVVMDGVGCEKFAEYVFKYLNKKIKEETDSRVKVYKVQCWEHGENMAEYYE